MMKLNRAAGRICLVFAAMLALGLLAEGGFRLFRVFRPPRAVRDPVLGWRSNGPVVRRSVGIRADGVRYPIEYRTEANGFRFWETNSAARHRLLVVGDSFTEALQVSNDKTYYAVLRGMLGRDWALFACGMGGYGTLQELLVLEEYLAVVHPDVVIWQWCSNDLWNNTYALDSRTHDNFNTTPRPYLEDDGIHVRSPHAVPLLTRHSDLWQVLGARFVTRWQTRRRSPWDTLRLDQPEFREALRVTGRVADRAGQLLRDTPTWVFVVGDPEVAALLDPVGLGAGFHMVPSVMADLDRAREAGVVVHADASVGGHWSEEGHAVVARTLFEAIRPVVRQDPD